jgi:hypothetical protein
LGLNLQKKLQVWLNCITLLDQIMLSHGILWYRCRRILSGRLLKCWGNTCWLYYVSGCWVSL